MKIKDELERQREIEEMRMTMYNAKSLMSIANFWGEDITPEQELWLATEADGLPEPEKGKFFDLYYRYEA